MTEFLEIVLKDISLSVSKNQIFKYLIISCNQKKKKNYIYIFSNGVDRYYAYKIRGLLPLYWKT